MLSQGEHLERGISIVPCKNTGLDSRPGSLSWMAFIEGSEESLDFTPSLNPEARLGRLWECRTVLRIQWGENSDTGKCTLYKWWFYKGVFLRVHVAGPLMGTYVCITRIS